MQPIEITANSDTGRVREVNEDSFYYCASGSLFGVFDGVGGGVDGELASRSAANTLKAFTSIIDHDGKGTFRDKFFNFFQHTDRSIQEIAATISKNSEVGTTATIGFLEKKIPAQASSSDTVSLHPYKLHLCILGDSRAYLSRQGNLIQLGLDQSWENTQIREGLIPSEHDIIKNSNAISTALGFGEPGSFDYYTTWIQSGDMLLLCTDGLHGYVPHSQISKILIDSANAGLEETNQYLIDAANRRGGRDNITSLLVKIPGASNLTIGPSALKELPSKKIKWVFGNHNGYLSSPMSMSRVNECPVNPEFMCNNLGHHAYTHDKKNLREILQIAGMSGAELLFN